MLELRFRPGLDTPLTVGFSVVVVIHIPVFMLNDVVGEDLHPVGHQHLERGVDPDRRHPPPDRGHQEPETAEAGDEELGEERRPDQIYQKGKKLEKRGQPIH